MAMAGCGRQATTSSALRSAATMGCRLMSLARRRCRSSLYVRRWWEASSSSLASSSLSTTATRTATSVCVGRRRRPPDNQSDALPSVIASPPGNTAAWYAAPAVYNLASSTPMSLRRPTWAPLALSPIALLRPCAPPPPLSLSSSSSMITAYFSTDAAHPEWLPEKAASSADKGVGSGGGGKKKNRNKHRSWSRRKSRRNKEKNEDTEALMGGVGGGPGGSKKKRQHSRKKQNQKQQKQSKQRQNQQSQHKKKKPAPPPLPTLGENNRPLMTLQRLQNDPTLASLQDNALQTMHNLKHVMKFHQRSSHQALQGQGGRRHEGVYVATLRSVFDPAVLPNVPSDAITIASLPSTAESGEFVSGDGSSSGGSSPSVSDSSATATNTLLELCHGGIARSKKAATALAAIDFLHQLTAECSIDLNNPPNLNKLQKEQMAAKAAEAQMLLELCRAPSSSFHSTGGRSDGGNRPRLVTEPYVPSSIELYQQQKQQGGGRRRRNEQQFVTELTLKVGHHNQLLRATGPPGVSKEESRLHALTAAASQPLIDLVGRERIEALQKIIEASPGGHAVPLTIPPLPDEAADNLAEVLGSPTEHIERMRAVEERKMKFEERFNRREAQTLSSWDRRRRDTANGASWSEQDEAERQRLLQIMQDEEQARLDLALSNPTGPQAQMKAIRDALPISSIRDSFVQALQSDRVVVVSGGTGSGKSTQCPQYILEHAIATGNGPNTNIIVTQPRRIAASSIADRVAAERNEAVGNSIGYAVRLNAVPPRDGGGTIEFVTTGVLLRRLMRDRSLRGASHVVIDEVHERDVNTDFLLVLLRDLLREREDLRVVLMSATLDAQSFGEYFGTAAALRDNMDGTAADEEGRGSSARRRRRGGGVPVMSVPAKPRHPVEIIHLEDIAGEMEDDGSPYGEGADNNGGDGIDGRPSTEEFSSDLRRMARDLLREHDQQLQLELEEAEAEEQAAMQLEALADLEDHGNILEEDSSDSDSDSDSDSGSEGEYEEEKMQGRGRGRTGKSSSLRRQRSLKRLQSLREAMALRPPRLAGGNNAPPSRTGGRTRSKAAADREVADLTTALVAKTALHVADAEIRAGRKGSVLCFLPGWDEIKAAMSIVEECRPELLRKLTVLPLHSTIPKEEQQKIFVPAADGKVKVILATNIAESSVTIDDALAIVDSGLVREMNWDAESAMSAMCTVPTSRASSTQRTGRAGRVAPGKCYRIYSRGTLQAMPERPTPEIKRTALENTCLQTCTMTSGGVEEFLSRAMDPPPKETVSFALDRLEKLGSITVNETGETLTPLGRLLSRLPLDPATGRMLIVGCVMKCLDPVLTAAACLSSRNPFYSPPGMRDEAREIRRGFCDYSDLMATVRAYDEFVEKTQTDGWDVARSWASDNFISVAAMTTISSVKSQLLNELQRIGLIQDGDLERRFRKKKVLRPDASVNQHAGNESLFTAVWATGLPDNLASRRHLANFGTLRTRTEDHAGIHPSSVSFHRKPPHRSVSLPPWFFYHEMLLSSQVFIRNCTAMTPEQIVLFGGNTIRSWGSSEEFGEDSVMMAEESVGTSSQSSARFLVLDDWAVVDSRCDRTINLLTAIRREIDAALALKVMSPRKNLPDPSQEIVDAVSETFYALDDRDFPQDAVGNYGWGANGDREVGGL